MFVVAGTTLPGAHAQVPQHGGVRFENVRIFNGTAGTLSTTSKVLLVGNVFKTTSTSPIAAPPDAAVTRIAGGGRTLMPGLIDAHTHIMFATVPQLVVLTSDVGFINVAATQGDQLANMVRWYAPAEAPKMATAGNAELLALSGLRSPCAGKLGVVQEGALADLILVDGDPLANIELVAEPARYFIVIMKDGKVFNHLDR